MQKPASINPMAEKVNGRLCELIENGSLNNEDMVQIIELVGGYLNLQTRSEYSKQNNISYNGAKKHRKNIVLFGVKFIIDNN